MSTEKKREGKTEIKKLEYLENEKTFLDETKNIYHYLRSII